MRREHGCEENEEEKKKTKTLRLRKEKTGKNRCEFCHRQLLLRI